MGRDVGVHDGFLDLGGHSLLVMRAISRVEHQLGVTVNVRDFMFKTISQLAALCEDKLASGERIGTRAIR